MSIVDKLTPAFYRPVQLVVEIAPDVTLTDASLTFFSDVRILNKDTLQSFRTFM